MVHGMVSGRMGGVWVAGGAGLAVLLGSGVAYRAAAARFGRTASTAALPRGTLEQLPTDIEGWTGASVALDEAVVRITDTEDHLSRLYSRSGGAETVSVFIGYGIHMRDLMPHRPEVCYPGAGWTLEASRPAELLLDDGSELRCRVHEFSRGGLDTRRVTVLNYYIIDGMLEADVSAVRSRAWRFDADVGYMAQVQISAAGDGLGRTAEDTVRAFAVDSASPIRSFLNEAVERIARGSQAEGRS